MIGDLSNRLNQIEDRLKEGFNQDQRPASLRVESSPISCLDSNLINFKDLHFEPPKFCIKDGKFVSMIREKIPEKTSDFLIYSLFSRSYAQNGTVKNNGQRLFNKLAKRQDFK